MKKVTLFSFLLFSVFYRLQAQSSWPAETWSNATNLTSLYAGFSNNLSGAHWNPQSRELWLVINGPGTIVKVIENGIGGFQYEAEWNPNGDLEGITQSDLSDTTVFVIQENTGEIKEFDVSSPGIVNLVHTWDISLEIPDYANSDGPEGITFVPDEWLISSGFKDQSGALYISQHGMGGLIFVAHQNGGNIYVFDLNRSTNAYTFVGEYETNRDESAGLEFDRSTGYLYIWHNTGNNYLEVTDLSSFPAGNIRKFTSTKEFFAPDDGNLEGFALTPADTNEDWCWITVDDGESDALRWFNQFDPCLVYADFTVTNQEICEGSSVTFDNNSVGTCGSETYQWNFGQGASPENAEGAGPHLVTYNSSGAKNITLTVEGEITDVTTKTGFVNVNPVYLQEVSESICSGDSFTFPDGSMQSNIAEQVIDTSYLLTFGNACDSIIITTLNVNPVYLQEVSESICSGDSFTFPDGSTQSNITNQVIDTSYLLTFGNDCDSIIITTLNVNPVYLQEVSESICSGDSFTFPEGSTQSNITNQVIDTSYLLTFGAACDSIIITTLNVNPVYFQEVSESICNGDNFTFPDGSTQSNITNQVIDTSYLLTFGNDCDSIIITTLNVNPVYLQEVSESICSGDSFTFPDGLTQSNIAEQVIDTSYLLTFGNACDSIIITTLNVNPVYLQEVSESICSGDSFTFPDGSMQSNITNQVIDTSYLLTFGNDCDSIIITTLNVNSIYFQEVSAAVCSGESYTFPDGLTQSNITNQVIDTSSLIGNGNDCDSIIITTLNVNPVYFQTNNAFVCSGDSFTFPDGSIQSNIMAQVIDTSYLFTSANSCDSVIITTLNVHPAYFQTNKAFVCSGDSYTFPDGSIQTNITAQVIDTSYLFTAVNSCDSIIITTLNVHPAYFLTNNDFVCSGDSYTFPDGSIQSNITAQVIDTSYLFTSANLCDSVIITTLEVILIDTSINVTGAILTSNALDATYQWIDCSTMLPIPGETNQEFIASVSGLNAAIITENGCTDTSNCQQVIITSILNHIFEQSFDISPNPTPNNLNIDLKQLYNDITIIVKNTIGQHISTHRFNSTDKVFFDIEGQPGIYFINLSTGDGKSATFKVLKN